MTHRLMQRAGPFAVAVAIISSSGSSMQPQREQAASEWRADAGTAPGLKYSPLDQITEDNVKDLQIVWKWPSVEVELQKSNPVLRVSRNENTPLMANGVLYTVTGLGLIAALDPGTGQTRWVYDPESYKAGRPNNGGFLSRSFGYWTDGTVERLLVGTHDAYLISIDPRTGRPDMGFGTDGWVDLTTGIRDVQRSTNFSARGPLIAGDVAIVGSSIADGARNKEAPPGDVKAFDVRTGKLLYVFNKRSGALVREIEMDGFAAAAPMTYLHAGKQYLVMAVGGNEDAAIVAFGLPGTRRN